MIIIISTNIIIIIIMITIGHGIPTMPDARVEASTAKIYTHTPTIKNTVHLF